MNHLQFPAAAAVRRRPHGLALLLAGTALAITACHRSEPGAVAAESNGAAEAAAVQAVAPPAPAAAPATVGAASTPAPTQTPEPPPRELTLSLESHPADAAAAPEALNPERGQLPDLFAGDKPTSKVAVAGSLLTDPEEKRVLESVNGAELSIEVKTR